MSGKINAIVRIHSQLSELNSDQSILKTTFKKVLSRCFCTHDAHRSVIKEAGKRQDPEHHFWHFMMTKLLWGRVWGYSYKMFNRM